MYGGPAVADARRARSADRALRAGTGVHLRFSRAPIRERIQAFGENPGWELGEKQNAQVKGAFVAVPKTTHLLEIARFDRAPPARPPRGPTPRRAAAPPAGASSWGPAPPPPPG